MPPTFIKPTSLDALVATYAAIGSSAPKTPLFYYHIPTKTGVDRQATFLQATNVSWVFCSGTTGESVDLTVAERKLIAERWMALSKKSGAFRVIVHVGAESIVDTKEMAAHAE